MVSDQVIEMDVPGSTCVAPRPGIEEKIVGTVPSTSKGAELAEFDRPD
jgi:hypothetical protein